PGYRHVKSVDRLFFVSTPPKKPAYHQGIPTMKIWHRRCIVTALEKMSPGEEFVGAGLQNRSD
ncbi:hypothetical protein, partial [Klebsiella pneumoniae]|uniref:hypothetical protein n=1 Tax=Klebsiella pneumoniae TaxID=573 RepID=UPI003EE37625